MPRRQSIKKSVLIEETETEMRVTLTELGRGLLDEPYELRVFRGATQAWEVEVVTQSKQVHQIQTQRGPTRSWLALDKAIESVLDYCPGVTGMTVEIAGVTLTWSNNAIKSTE